MLRYLQRIARASVAGPHKLAPGRCRGGLTNVDGRCQRVVVTASFSQPKELPETESTPLKSSRTPLLRLT